MDAAGYGIVIFSILLFNFCLNVFSERDILLIDHMIVRIKSKSFSHLM